MRPLAVALAFFALVALGQVGQVTPAPLPQVRIEGIGYLHNYKDGGASFGLSIDAGGALVVATVATLDLFVDDDGGSNLFDCLDAGSACKTHQGAWNKMPNVIRNNVVIHVAGGVYDAGFSASGAVLDREGATTPTITVLGAVANITPATGSATGTVTSATIGSGVTHGTLVDGTQTWSVNDPAIVNHFVSILTGAGSGQLRIVASNTATSITLAGNWGVVPDATSTYALQAPTWNIIGTQGIFATGNSVGILIKNANCALTSGACVSTQNNTAATTASQITSTGTTSTAFAASSLSTLLVSIAAVTTTSGVAASAGGFAATVSMSSSNIVNAAVSDSQPAVSVSGTGALGSFSGLNIKSGRGISATAGGVISSASGIRVNCNSVVTSIAVLAGISGLPGAVTAGPVDVSGCDFGGYAQGFGWYLNVSGIFSGAATLASFNAVHGGSIYVNAASQTITAPIFAEADYTPASQTDPFANGADTTCLTTSASKVCNQ